MSVSLHPVPRDVIASLDSGASPAVRFCRWIQARWMDAQARAELRALSDRELADIGIRRCEIDLAIAGRLDRS